MTAEPDSLPAYLQADPLDLAADFSLSECEASYVSAARVPNTLRGYRSGWSEFTTWCSRMQLDTLPVAAATISNYLTELARAVLLGEFVLRRQLIFWLVRVGRDRAT